MDKPWFLFFGSEGEIRMPQGHFFALHQSSGRWSFAESSAHSHVTAIKKQPWLRHDCFFMVAKGRFELSTCRVWTGCSSQLSYFAISHNRYYYKCNEGLCQDKDGIKLNYLMINGCDAILHFDYKMYKK